MASELVARTVKQEDILWDASACAEYLGYSRKRFVDYVSKKHNFPKGRVNGRRWVAREVIEWACNS